MNCPRCGSYDHAACCSRCDSTAHSTAKHKAYYDDTPEERQAYLRGWQEERTETRVPAPPGFTHTQRTDEAFQLGKLEAAA